jgi:hypothetical protein
LREGDRTLEIYSRLSLGDAQKTYDQNIGRFGSSGWEIRWEFRLGLRPTPPL